MPGKNVTLVLDFVREWDSPAPHGERIASYFADDAVYHNIPMQPVIGKDAIGSVLAGMAPAFASRGWEVKHVAEGEGCVMTERVDRFVFQGRPVEVAVMGIFEVRDGKITAWRDYFDLGQWQSQLNPTS